MFSNEVFEITAIAKLNTVAPVALGVEMKNLYDKVVRTGYFWPVWYSDH